MNPCPLCLGLKRIAKDRAGKELIPCPMCAGKPLAEEVFLRDARIPTYQDYQNLLNHIKGLEYLVGVLAEAMAVPREFILKADAICSGEVEVTPLDAEEAREFLRKE